jgi:hypothetical protein
MMKTENMSEMLDINSILTQMITQEDFIVYICSKIFKQKFKSTLLADIMTVNWVLQDLKGKYVTHWKSLQK